MTEFYHVYNSLCAQVLRNHIVSALLHCTRAVGVSQTLRRGIFTRQSGGAAVRFDIGWPSCLVVIAIIVSITIPKH